MNFASLSPDERPREKLLSLGPEALSLAELLAVVLRTGRSGEDVVSLSQSLLVKMGGLEGLSRASVAELMQEKGLKEAKAASLAAALELGKRLAVLRSGEKTDWKSRLVSIALDTKFQERESIYALFLSARDKLLDEAELSYGGISGAYLDLPVFFRHAVRLSAAKIILVHNHPDGSSYPSKEDVALTEHVEKALRTLGIRLKGHYIAAEGELYLIHGAAKDRISVHV
ncbi:MAG: DNA repair protein RadC [Synergistaceae bacterium]|nr:DNA repair protein RadC [Synergistaceae bacterium]